MSRHEDEAWADTHERWLDEPSEVDRLRTEVADLRRELERVDALRDVADGCAESLRAEVERLTRERDAERDRYQNACKAAAETDEHVLRVMQERNEARAKVERLTRELAESKEREDRMYDEHQRTAMREEDSTRERDAARAERDRLREAARALLEAVKRMQGYGIHNVARYGLGTYRDVLDAADALAALLDSTGDDDGE